MIRANVEYLAFDDRKLVLIGIPVLAFLIPLVFWGLDILTMISNGLFEYFEGIVYCTFYWLTCRYIIIALRRRYKAFRYIRKRMLLQTLIIIPIVPLSGFLISQFFCLWYPILEIEDAFEPRGYQSFFSTYFIVFTCFIFYEMIYFIYMYKQAMVEKNQLQLAHVQGQLENLRNQINPHFLFNSLNTLMNLIPTNPERAMGYLDKLSKFYRYAVSNQQQTLTPVQTELEIAKVYTELLQERFQDAIQIHLPEKEFAQAQILPLSLQLLIENAVKHNIVSRKRPLEVRIELDEEKEYIWVHNNIQKKIQEVSSTGMGLKNIQKRFSFFTDKPVEIQEEAKQFSVGLPFIFEIKNKDILAVATDSTLENNPTTSK